MRLWIWRALNALNPHDFTNVSSSGRGRVNRFTLNGVGSAFCEMEESISCLVEDLIIDVDGGEHKNFDCFWEENVARVLWKEFKNAIVLLREVVAAQPRDRKMSAAIATAGM